MWYMNVNYILSLVCAAVLLAFISRIPGRSAKYIKQFVLLAFNIGFLYLFDRKLMLFYLGYLFVIFIFCKLVTASKRYSKFFFLTGILFSLSIFLIYRLSDADLILAPSLRILIPVGLAYNMLKAIDVLYMAYYAEQNISLAYFANYMLFIPTFTSGPILRYRDFEQDSSNVISLSAEASEIGVKRIILGLFKKIVLVEPLTLLYNTLLAGNPYWGRSAGILVIYYILLFFDFSGYSDIAIGFGKLMGYRVPENFKRPFSSPTLTQFWRNWHASLGDWFREHIFTLLIKKNKSRLVSALISFVIMLSIGLWHGFNPLFILWGIYHGVLLMLENLTNMTTVNKKKVSKLYYYFRCLAVNILVAMGTIFFSSDMQTVVRILKGFTVFIR